MLVILLSQGSFFLVDLVIEHENHVMAHGRAFDTCDDQFFHIGPIESDNLRVSIMNSLNMDALLPISRDEMTTICDVIDSFCHGQKNLSFWMHEYVYQNKSTSLNFKLNMHNLKHVI